MQFAAYLTARKQVVLSALESRVMVFDFVAHVVLAFSIGVATSLALAAAVLLLASEAQPDTAYAVTQPASGSAAASSIDAINRNLP